MKTTIRRIRATRALAAAAAIGAVVALSGCTTEGPGGGASVASDDLGFLTQAQFDEIQTKLKAATEIPKEEVPTEKVDVAKLKGERVLVMPSASYLTDCDTISKQAVAQVEELGMKGTYFQTDGTTASWVAGMQQAISQKYDAVVLFCGIDPALIPTQVKQATSAGITVSAGALYDNTLDGGKVLDYIQSQTNSPLYTSFEATALQSIMDNREKPFDALVLPANEIPSTPVFVKAVKDVYAKYCPKCGITEQNVPLADVATKMTPTVQAALTSNKDIKVVIPMYGSGDTNNAVAAIKAVGRSDVRTYGSYGMPIADLKQMGTPGNFLGAVSRHNNLLRMVTTMDQTFRAMAGQETVDPNVYVDPNRLVTPANVKDFLAVSNEGFGDEVVNEYKALWGLSS